MVNIHGDKGLEGDDAIFYISIYGNNKEVLRSIITSDINMAAIKPLMVLVAGWVVVVFSIIYFLSDRFYTTAAIILAICIMFVIQAILTSHKLNVLRSFRVINAYSDFLVRQRT